MIVMPSLTIIFYWDDCLCVDHNCKPEFHLWLWFSRLHWTKWNLDFIFNLCNCYSIVFHHQLMSFLDWFQIFGEWGTARPFISSKPLKQLYYSLIHMVLIVSLPKVLSIFSIVSHQIAYKMQCKFFEKSIPTFSVKTRIWQRSHSVMVQLVAIKKIRCDLILSILI